MAKDARQVKKTSMYLVPEYCDWIQMHLGTLVQKLLVIGSIIYRVIGFLH